MSLIKLGFKDKSKRDTLQDLAAGGIAGAVSSFAVAPLDTVADTMRQWRTGSSSSASERAASKSAISVAKKIYKEHGIPGLYTGSTTKMLKIAPASAISFGLYGLAKSKLQRENK
jgi:Mitochondrial carrier protein